MKTLKNIGIGLVYALMAADCLIGSVLSFALIFDSQSFRAVLHFVIFLVTLTTSLWFAWVIGKHLSDDNENIVRCKDCTEWDAKECECSHWYGFKENDFCCHGIKRGAEGCQGKQDQV